MVKINKNLHLWKDAKTEKPLDDRNLLGINQKLHKQSVIKCYYDKEFDAFISMESFNLVAVDITHYLYVNSLFE